MEYNFGGKNHFIRIIRSIRIISLIGCVSFAAGILAQEVSKQRLVVRGVAERAAAGDAEALYQLAMVHEQGFDSIPQDTVRALRLYEQSAERGNLKAQNYLGYKLIKEGDVRGLKWLENAAIAGDHKAQANIGYLLLNSDLVEHDAPKAAYWLERAAAGGVATASSMLGDLYRDGNGVAQDSLQAEAHYTAAIDAGLKDAAYKLVDLRGREWESLPDSARYSKALYLYSHRAPELAIPIFRSLAGIDPADENYNSYKSHNSYKSNYSDNSDYSNSSNRSDYSDNPYPAKSLAMLGDAYTRSMGVGYSHDKSLEYYLAAAIEGDPSGAFVISETLEIFPDALEAYLPADAPAGADTPAYWREQAAARGVSTAEDAHQRLFTP